MNKKIGLLFLLTMAGCAPSTRVPRPPVPQPPAPPSPPVFEGTAGEVVTAGNGSLYIQYKGMRILVDPAFEKAGRGRAIYSEPIDYLLVTDTRPEHFESAARETLRKDLKILAPAPSAAEIKGWGFSQARGLESQQRIMLQKDAVYVFVSAIPGKSAAGVPINSYLLEFDNGRNVFISGDVSSADSLREFLYTLRDDGKEIHFGFIRGADEPSAAAVISLFQPRYAFVETSSARPMREASLRQALETEIFNGDLVLPKADSRYPF